MTGAPSVMPSAVDDCEIPRISTRSRAALTVTAVTAVRPAYDASIVVEPEARQATVAEVPKLPVANFCSTGASDSIRSSRDRQVTASGEMTVPVSSVTCASHENVSPGQQIRAVGIVNWRIADVAKTETRVWPVRPRYDPRTVVSPGDSARMTLPWTEATAGLLESQMVASVTS